MGARFGCSAGRFSLAVSQIVGKRLTYAEVTGKNHQPEVFLTKRQHRGKRH
jgi:hypothetical protein